MIARLTICTTLILLGLLCFACFKNGKEKEEVAIRQREEYLEKAIEKAGAGEYKMALSFIHQAIETEPKYKETIITSPQYRELYVIRGLIESYLGNNNQALKDLREARSLSAIRNNYFDPDIGAMIAAIQNIMGDHKQAYDTCSNVIERTKYEYEGETYFDAHPLVFYQRAIAASKLKQIREPYSLGSMIDEFSKQAMKDFDRALYRAGEPGSILLPKATTKIKVRVERINPEDESLDILVAQGEILKTTNYRILLEYDLTDVYIDRAELKRDLGDYRGAIQDFSKAIELNPNDAYAYMLRGFTKIKLADQQGAIQDFNKAVELSPSNSIFYTARAASKTLLEDHSGAIIDCDKAIELNPINAETFMIRGISKIELGQKNEGCLDLSKAGELGYFEAYDSIKELCQ